MTRLEACSAYLRHLSLHEEEGESLTHMKLQKLLYYSQGFHMAIHDAPLFDEDFCRWQYGPVIPDYYHQLKHNGSSHLDGPTEEELEQALLMLSEEMRSVLEDVHNTYGRYSAWALSRLTHEEAPWKETPALHIITKRKMKNYFLTQLVDE